MRSAPPRALFSQFLPKIANPTASAQFLLMNATLVAELKQLSSAEKLLLVEELWNDIAKESNTIEPPAWHDQVLAEDAAEYAANPARGDSWSIVKQRIIRQA